MCIDRKTFKLVIRCTNEEQNILSVKKKYLTANFFSCMIAKVQEKIWEEAGYCKMEKIVEQGLLYDFYGELLTAHQREVYESAVFEDMSPSEIAQEYGISRQGIHDLIKRCDKLLIGYEEKLQLVHKFLYIKEKAQQIETLTSEPAIKELVRQILKEL